MDRYTVSTTNYIKFQHWGQFQEFCELEVAAAGPDPHLSLAGWLSRGVDDLERAWRLACYVAPYFVAPAMIIWSVWPLDRILKSSYTEVFDWVYTNWKGLSLRTERRAVKSPEKLTKCLISAAHWVDNEYYGIQQLKTYDEAWDKAREIYSFGRYACIKYMESLHRYAGLPVSLSDLRPAGAWSPKLSLSYLAPEHDELLNRSTDSKLNIAKINEVGAQVHKELMPNLTPFQFEVLLCNYRQSLKSTYVGRHHDSELEQWSKLSNYWGPVSMHQFGDFFASRAALIEPEYLGEVNGWSGKRKELSTVFKDHGYFWTDATYDYNKTTDLAFPVRK